MPEQKKKFGCLSIVVIIIFIGVVVNAFRADDPSASPDADTPVTIESELPRLTLKDAVLEFERTDLETFAAKNCSILNEVDYEVADADLGKLPNLQAVKNSREAADLMKVQKVPPTEYLTYWLSSYDQSLRRIISALEDKTEGKYRSYTSWPEDLEKALIATCELGTKFSETRSALQTLGNEVARVRNLAASVPWYPEGFKAYSSEVAYKFVKSRGCDYYDCWNLDVITKFSCSYLYVEMNIYDNSESIVGFTNDSARNVRAGEIVKMRLDDLYDGSSGRITEMTCS